MNLLVHEEYRRAINEVYDLSGGQQLGSVSAPHILVHACCIATDAEAPQHLASSGSVTAAAVHCSGCGADAVQPAVYAVLCNCAGRLWLSADLHTQSLRQEVCSEDNRAGACQRQEELRVFYA
eukprot:12174-Heterococcus_DN1.PRE.2